jgi:cytidyltransferase-like protein
MSTAFTAGTFDLLHPGHIRLFKRAKEKFGQLVVAVNRSEFVCRFKLRTPIMTLEERLEMVAACRFVDSAVINIGDEDIKPALLASRAQFFVHGNDWMGADLLKQLGVNDAWLQEKGIQMVFFSYTSGVSTSEILRRVASRQ